MLRYDFGPGKRQRTEPKEKNNESNLDQNSRSTMKRIVGEPAVGTLLAGGRTPWDKNGVYTAGVRCDGNAPAEVQQFLGCCVVGLPHIALSYRRKQLVLAKDPVRLGSQDKETNNRR